MLTLRVKLPALVTVDLRIVAPTERLLAAHRRRAHKYNDGVRFAPLPAIMAAKKKPLDVKTLADVVARREAHHALRASSSARAARTAGIKVKDVAELVDKLANDAKVL